LVLLRFAVPVVFLAVARFGVARFAVARLGVAVARFGAARFWAARPRPPPVLEPLLAAGLRAGRRRGELPRDPDLG
jgi:hypothetical protein